MSYRCFRIQPNLEMGGTRPLRGQLTRRKTSIAVHHVTRKQADRNRTLDCMECHAMLRHLRSDIWKNIEQKRAKKGKVPRNVHPQGPDCLVQPKPAELTIAHSEHLHTGPPCI